MIHFACRRITQSHFLLAICLIGLSLMGCASSPTAKSEQQPAAKQAAAPSNGAGTNSEATNPKVQKLQSELAREQKTLKEANDSAQKLSEQLKLVELKNKDLSSRNEKLLQVLSSVAFAQKRTPKELMASAAADIPAPSGSLRSLTANSMIQETVTASGEHLLVDARARAASSSPIFLSVSYGNDEPASLSLTVQYRYPLDASPFLTQSITLVQNGTAHTLPLDKFKADWYRSGPFKVEAFSTTDMKVIRSVVRLILGTSNSSAAAPTTIVEKGLTDTVSRIIPQEVVNAVSNVVYAFHELGGKEL